MRPCFDNLRPLFRGIIFFAATPRETGRKAEKITEIRTGKILKTDMIKSGREVGKAVFSCQRDVAGVRRVAYIIERESGESRALFDTPCACFYTLVICAPSDACRLADVSRDLDEAIALCMRFADAAVLPVGAEDVFVELCYT